LVEERRSGDGILSRTVLFDREKAEGKGQLGSSKKCRRRRQKKRKEAHRKDQVLEPNLALAYKKKKKNPFRTVADSRRGTWKIRK